MQLTIDKLTDVYYSSTHHDEDQPAHLKVLDFNICVGRCVEEYGNPCQNFCPANVYEMVEAGTKRSGYRSTFQTACTARPATSWIPTRLSTGFRRKAAAVQIIGICERSFESSPLLQASRRVI